MTNDSRTRAFLAIPVIQGLQEIRQVAAAVDTTCHRFGQPRLSADYSFHISIAWSLEDARAHMSGFPTDFKSNTERDRVNDSTETDLAFDIDVNYILYTIGRNTIPINLRED